MRTFVFPLPTHPLEAFPLLMLAGGAVLSACDNLPPEGPPPTPRVCSSSQLRGDIYRIPLTTERLPDFAALHPVESTCTDRLAVTARAGTEG